MKKNFIGWPLYTEFKGKKYVELSTYEVMAHAFEAVSKERDELARYKAIERIAIPYQEYDFYVGHNYVNFEVGMPQGSPLEAGYYPGVLRVVSVNRQTCTVTVANDWPLSIEKKNT